MEVMGSRAMRPQVTGSNDGEYDALELSQILASSSVPIDSATDPELAGPVGRRQH